MELPEGYEQPGMVCRLHKSLYGLKQAPRNWDRLIHGFLTKDMAFKATVSDPSLYFKRSRSGRLMMIYRFVDDMQGSGFVGRLANTPVNGTKYKIEQVMAVASADVEDWMVRTSDGIYGGYTARYQIKDLPKAQAEKLAGMFRD